MSQPSSTVDEESEEISLLVAEDVSLIVSLDEESESDGVSVLISEALFKLPNEIVQLLSTIATNEERYNTFLFTIFTYAQICLFLLYKSNNSYFYFSNVGINLTKFN